RQADQVRLRLLEQPQDLRLVLRAALEAGAIDLVCRQPAFARAGESLRVRHVGDHRRYLGVRDRAALHGVRDRLEIRSPAGEKSRDSRRAARLAQEGTVGVESIGSTTTRRLPPPFTFPMAYQRCREASHNFAARARSPGARNTTIPMPMLKTRCISSKETRPSRAIISKTGRTGHDPERIATSSPSGRTRGMLS